MGGLLSQLVVEIAGDDAPLSRTLAGVRGSLDGMGGDAGRAGRSISSGLGDGFGANFAGQIRTAMAQALQPMETLSRTMVAQFDRVGGTIITSARRVDSHMKFQSFMASLDKIEDAIPNAFGRGSVRAIRSLFKIKSFLGSIGDVAKRSLSGHGFGGVSNKVSGSYNNLALNITGIGPAARASTAAVTKLHGSMLGLIGAGSLIGGLGIGFSKAIHGASDLNETLNKTDVIFGPGAAAVKAGADQMAADFGVVKTEFMDMGAQYGQILQGMGGATKDASAATSVQLAKLTADASSIFNKSFGEAGGAIASALRGQSEPISAFGIDVQEAAVKQEALRMGLVKGSQELTTQQKVMARTSLISKGLRVAQGDLAATQGGFANASRAAWGRVTNVLSGIGQAFMPVVEGLLGGVNRFLKGIQTWVDGNKATLDSWAASAQTALEWVGSSIATLGGYFQDHFNSMNEGLAYQTGSLTPLGDAWNWLKETAISVWEGIGLVIRNASDIMAYAGVTAQQYLMNTGVAFEWLMTTAGTFGNYLANNWVSMIQDAVNGAWSLLSNLGHNIGELFHAAWEAINGNGFHPNFTPLLEGFKAVSEKLPEIAKPAWISLQQDLDTITDRIGKNEIKRIEANAQAARNAANAPAPTTSAGGRPGAAPRDEDVSTKKDKKNSSTDLAGFAKQLQEGVFSKGSAAERTAKAAERTEGILKRVETNGLKVAGGMGLGAAIGLAAP